jgi:hypothetical protein
VSYISAQLSSLPESPTACACAISAAAQPPFSPLDLPACVVAARPSGLAALDALPIDHRRRGAGLAPGALAVEHDQVVGERKDGGMSSRTQKRGDASNIEIVFG